MHRRLIAFSVVISITTAFHASAAENGDSEIRYLLNAVGDSGCTFIRNGQQHQASEASSHLLMKYEQGKQWVRSAEQFIEHIASKSSVSGDPYYIECIDTPSRSTQEWLTQRLAQHRKENE